MRATSSSRQRETLQDFDVTAAVLYLVSWSLLDLVLYFQHPSGTVAPWYASHALSLAFLAFLGLRFWPLIFLGSFLNGYFLWFDGRVVPVMLLAIVLAVAYGAFAIFWERFQHDYAKSLKLGPIFVGLTLLLTSVVSAAAYFILARDRLIDPAEPVDWIARLAIRDSLDIGFAYPFAVTCLMPLGRRLIFGQERTPELAASMEKQLLPGKVGTGMLLLLSLAPILAWVLHNSWTFTFPVYGALIPLLALTLLFGYAGAAAGSYALYALFYPALTLEGQPWISEQLLLILIMGVSCFALAHILQKQRQLVKERLLQLEKREAELQKSLQQSESSRQQMQQLHENIERMILRSSQEMRTPLTPIFIWAQMLRESTNRKTVVEASNAIQQNIERQTRLLDELNDTLRLSTGKLKLNIETVELNGLLQNIVATLRPLAEQKSLRIFVGPESSPEYVLADKEQLTAALTKLLDHVLRYGQEGSSISIIFSRQHHETLLHIKHAGYGPDQKNVLQLLNAGAGMDEESFLTASNFDLGLYVAKKLIEMQGGYLTAASLHPKPGVLFSLTLRKANARSTAHMPPPTQTPVPLEDSSVAPLKLLPPYWQNQHILIVEDDPFTLTLLEQVLQAEGLKTVACLNSTLALEAFHRVQPALVIADLGLPDMNGFDLIRRFKKTARREFIAIAFSACVSPEAQTKAVEAGFSAFLAKPLQVKELLKTLDQLLSLAPPEVKRGQG